MDVLPPMLCVVLRVSSSRKTMATESIAVDLSSHAVTWNEEFHLDNVTSNDELKFYCVDRCKSGPPHQLPLRDDNVSASMGFIGKGMNGWSGSRVLQ
ncbi:hypothetical protein PINS_up002312 [Pythium insidiosum]|nr:hypothetical protein PINS_up002312 [Pythium insidiosum]